MIQSTLTGMAGGAARYDVQEQTGAVKVRAATGGRRILGQTEERAAPPGTERWFHAPRNPNIPAPGKREILVDSPDSGGDGVSAYRGATLPPAAESLIARGGLFIYRSGVLFLPLAPAEAKSWLEEMRPAAEFAIMALGNAFLPFGPLVFDAARDTAISEALFGKHDHEMAKRQLAARWEHPGVFVIPCVNITGVSYSSVRGRGLLAKRTGYLAVTAQEVGGQEVGYTFGLPTTAEGLPGRFFAARMARELEFYAARARRKVTGYDERARAALASLGLNVTAPDVTWDSIAEAVERQSKAGPSPLDHVTLGQVLDTLNQVGEAAWSDAKQRLVNPTQEMARLIVADLEPMLPYYRRVPAMAQQIEAAERVAAGESNRDWTPSWRPEDYHFNFPPGDYPPTKLITS